MNTRRKFILNGGLTAAALFIAKPFKSIAGSGSFLNIGGTSHLVFLHSINLQQKIHQRTINFFKAIKTKTSSSILISTSPENVSKDFDYDTSVMNGGRQTSYSIITKSGIKTGLIYINTISNSVVNQANRLASFLKKQKGCQIVACVSQLGYYHADIICDKTLAVQSKDIDIIIGAHATNFSKHAMVLHNSNNEEVLLQNAAASTEAFGKIEIGFNAKGQKNHVHLFGSFEGKFEQQSCIVRA